MFYYLDEGLIEADRVARGGRRWKVLEAQRRAIELMTKVIDGEISLAAVQGPPGTGKTSVVEAFARDRLADFVTSTDRELIVYLAPTNYLAFEAFRRVSAQLIRAGYDVRSLIRVMRVYGSRIKPFKRDQEIGNAEAGELADLTGEMDSEVKIVFATEFQRISTKLGDLRPSKIHIVADEASKSPYFRVFLPLADKIARKPEEYYPYSLLVLGDPQQAITVPDEYRDMGVPLLMKFTENVLKSRGLEDYWIMLDTTFRLPSPSENPISYGFYRGELTACYFAHERMKAVKDSVLDYFDRIRSLIARSGLGVGSKTEMIFDAVEEAVSSDSPIVVVDTSSFKSGDTFDPERVKLATIAAAAFQAAAEFSGAGYSVAVTAPYCDIADSVSFKFRKTGLPRPRAATVQSIIGGEADVVIAALGKEWSSGRPDEMLTTIYSREPEVLNVQLSRHRSALVIVGNVERLGKMEDPRIKKTVQKLHELHDRGVVSVSVRV